MKTYICMTTPPSATQWHIKARSLLDAVHRWFGDVPTTQVLIRDDGARVDIGDTIFGVREEYETQWSRMA